MAACCATSSFVRLGVVQRKTKNMSNLDNNTITTTTTTTTNNSNNNNKNENKQQQYSLTAPKHKAS
jgi:hypothetical protein